MAVKQVEPKTPKPVERPAGDATYLGKDGATYGGKK